MNKTQISQDLVLIYSCYMDNNSYIVFKGNKAVIIDPSFSGQDLINSIPNDCQVVAVLLTHAHFDHCFDTKMILKKWPNAKVYLHEGDKNTYFKYRYDDLANMSVEDFSNSIIWFNSKNLKIDDFEFKVIPTPGHTNGSVTYVYNKYVFVGDTLFYNSYGRTDLGNSSHYQMVKSLRKLWSELKDDDLILTGHNRWATFAEIKQKNIIVNEIIKK